MIQSLQEKLQDLDSNNILFCHTSTGFLYYTFAGKSVNKAIAVSQSLHNSRVTDIVIEVPYKIQWQNIPSEPIDYLEIIDQLFDTTGQSIYQALLPTSLQREELIQNWITDPVIAKVIKRLKMTTPVEILFDIFARSCDFKAKQFKGCVVYHIRSLFRCCASWQAIDIFTGCCNSIQVCQIFFYFRKGTEAIELGH